MIAPAPQPTSAGEWVADQLVIAAIVGGGVAVGAVVRRVWPFYRAMLRDAADVAPTDGRARYEALDGLRGLLCLLVVVHHAAITAQLPAAGGHWVLAYQLAPAVLLPGDLAVSLFFAITGFLFYARVVETNRAPATLRFWIGRAMRIGPALVASGAAIFALESVTRRAFAPDMTPRFGRVALSVATLGAVGPGFAEHNAGVFWTLAYEWPFYACFPLLAWASVRGVPAWLRLTIATALACAAWRVPRFAPAMMFLPGLFAAHAMNVPAVRRVASRPVGSAIVALVLLGFATLSNGNGFRPAGVVAIAVTFALIVAGCDVFGLLRLPALRAVGVASYSVYLLHGLVLYAARPWLFAIADRPTALWLAMCALATVTTLIAFASYRWIEHPGIAVGRRLRVPLSLRGRGIRGADARSHAGTRGP